MATIPTDLLRSDIDSGNGIFSRLLAKARLLLGMKIEQRDRLAERIDQFDADFYDRFYG